MLLIPNLPEIRNFLLIKKLSINLIKGFNTFTGETGAGKSIIIDALKLTLGGKNYSSHNLKDNEITTIKAVFEINQKIKNTTLPSPFLSKLMYKILL